MDVFLFLILLVFVPVLNDAKREGYINLDCGSPEGTEYTDETTGLTYTSDADYISTGEKRDVSPNTELAGVPKFFSNARMFRSTRIFPDGDRNCYTLKPVKTGSKYLARVWFMYDNYDDVQQVPVFDLYMGVNLWLTIQLPGRGSAGFYEIVTVAEKEWLDVCLVRKDNLGKPYISALELKPLDDDAYKAAATQDLLCIGRDDIGSPDFSTYRFKDDPYDRFWWPFNLTDAVAIKGGSIDTNKDSNVYRPPQEVMRTAMEPNNATAPLVRTWPMFKSWNIYPRMFIYAHAGEVDGSARAAGKLREFRACIMQDTNICFGPFRTTDNSSTVTISTENIQVDPRKEQYVYTLHRTERSDLPPILNGFEIFLGQDRSNIPTYKNDLNAIIGVREFYGIKKNWMGDPCVPSKYAWEGLTCNSTAADNALGPHIIHLNLSESGLQGSVSASIGNLLLLESLDLSENGLTGELPDWIAKLSSLKSLNLSGNYFTGSVPPNLLRKLNNGSLQLSLEGNPELCKSDSCPSSRSKKMKPKLTIILILVSVATVVILGFTLICFWRKSKMVKKEKTEGTGQTAGRIGAMATSPSSFNLDNKRFTYDEIVDITDNFSRLLGRGGFATVYYGRLKHGSEVAVKMISHNSASSEFQTEAQLLTLIHHKNLVRFVGYCADGKNKALVLEYMPNGNLARILLDTDNNNNNIVLTWSQRLRIAIDIALGLEYLHVGCKPPIIHRDVKLGNILLNDKFEAKIADFGISKVFHDYDEVTHASTTSVKGTFGYLDPEYYVFHKLNEKSDVYAFGIILFVLITGKPAIIQLSDEERITIVEWVRSHISYGDLKSIIDPRLGENWETNSAWAAVEVAIESSRGRSVERPSMSTVVGRLKECLEGAEFKAKADSFDHRTSLCISDDSLFFPSSR